MNLIQAIILGALQGVSEFLPISSSGHLVLFQKIFGIQEPTKTFDIMLHVATLIPILIVYRQDILKLIKKPFQKMTYMLVIATIPTIIVAVLFGDVLESVFMTGKYLGYGFLLTGCFLMYAEKKAVNYSAKKEPTYFDSLIIGCMQAIAVLPAVSRSGSTITGGLARGVERKAAAKFAFLMSIPAICGALTLEIVDILKSEVVQEQIPFIPFIGGFLTAVIVGYFSINFLIKIIEKAKLKYFAYYVFTLGTLILIDQYFFNIIF